jgi:GNAT superfamily N-acetyltransferase
MLRDTVRQADIAAVERLVRRTKMFNEGEVAIARELVEENLAKGAERSGYHFLFAEEPQTARAPAILNGYACFGPIPATDGRFELYWIAVDPDARRRGLGARLQSAVEDVARTWGAKYLIAETSTTALYAPTRGFYRSVGYSHLADVPYWHADDDGLSIFGKRL